jgi:hypothetical protein
MRLTFLTPLDVYRLCSDDPEGSVERFGFLAPPLDYASRDERAAETKALQEVQDDSRAREAL